MYIALTAVRPAEYACASFTPRERLCALLVYKAKQIAIDYQPVDGGVVLSQSPSRTMVTSGRCTSSLSWLRSDAASGLRDDLKEDHICMALSVLSRCLRQVARDRTSKETRRDAWSFPTIPRPSKLCTVVLTADVYHLES